MVSVQAENLERALAELASGRALRQADFDGLAGLDREEAVALREAWKTLPDPVRMTIAAYIHQQSRETVDDDYDAAAVVALDDPIAIVRRFAVESLWETTDRGVGRRLQALFTTDDDLPVRVAAATVLAGFVMEREFGRGDLAWGDELVATLRASIEDVEIPVELRSSALMAVASRNEDWVHTAIREAYYSENRDYRLASLVAMGLTAQPAWLEYLYEQLQSEDPEFRKAAATACGEIADEEAVDPLADALDDEDPLVVVAAVAALAEIGGELAIEYLQEFRRRVPEELAPSLAEAIAIAREMETRTGDEDEEDDW
ncbi:MAG: HEAT repeat domain-containing protein [Dehalococcoidia bacterium]|nr:HEAT repeat domain-containing protein [Dehalococcoidia bacterium]